MTTSVELSSSSSSSYLLGMSLLLMSLVCLGTWPALLRLCSTERTAVAGQTIMKPPRDNRFAYLDYSLAYVISSSIPLIISSSFINNENDGGYDNDGSSSSSSSCYIQLVLIAMIGGTLLSLGNISMQWSTTVFGAPLTTVVAIQASLTVTIGTSINYVLEPTKTPKPIYLLFGVITFIIAIILASKAHLLYGEECNNNNKQQQQQQQQQQNNNNDPCCIELLEDIHKNNYQSTEETTIMVYNDDDDESSSSSSSSSSNYTDEEEDNNIDSVIISTTIMTEANLPSSSTSSSSMPKKALVVAIFGGCCFGFFSPAFNIAVNNPFANNSNEEEITDNTLSVTVANLWFSFAFALSSIIFNIILMYRPPIDSGLNKTTISRYLCGDEDLFSDRYLAICAGMVCGVANMLQFKGGSIVGFATSDLVQAYPLISTFWDIYVFHEFAKATSTIRLYIFAMYIMYISGIVCIIASAIL